jgi:hypothetical protein
MPAVKQAVSLVANTMDNGWIGRREVANLWLKDAVTQPEEARPGFQSHRKQRQPSPPEVIATEID